MAEFDTSAMSNPSPPDLAPSPGFHYWAFISYSHRDEPFARWLHRAIETYRIPTALVGRTVGGIRIPRRLVPIFRDRDELPGAADLGAKIHDALSASHALVVICSPSAATSRWVNEEVRSFKALGRGEFIVPVVIEGEPNASDRPELGLPECFPPALRFEIAADGTITDRRVDPLAADAREGKDGRADALLKAVAGLIGVGFDDLRRREERRRHKRQLLAACSGLIGLLAATGTYVGLADAGLGVPGGDLVRRYLDRHGITAFRPVPSREMMANAAQAARQAIRARLVAALPPTDRRQNDGPGLWEVAQLITALYRDPDATAGELRALPALMERYRPDLEAHVTAAREGTDSIHIGRAEPVLWTLLALSAGLSRTDALGEAERRTFRGYLDLAQEAAEAFGPGMAGGWNAFIRPSKPGNHSTYISSLALHAVLDLKRAGLCWRGDCARMEEMVAATGRWLVQTFSEEGRGGWRHSAGDDQLPDPSLTSMVLSALGRWALETGAHLPEPIQRAGLKWLTGLADRGYSNQEEIVTTWDVLLDRRGQATQLMPAVASMLWYPWSLQALTSWVGLAPTYGFAAEDRRGLERSLGRLLVVLSSEMLSDVLQRPNWVRAETQFGLDRAFELPRSGATLRTALP